ncbi:kinetochore protein NDC80 homolog isoform X2 [Sycon ciliatum]|uniref:kinetochore protein NDC80 homolog isoform X2 n=1 Tax=Sycon ciliatum TaxID=27933 RepID=UPI0031F6E883
MSSQPKERKGSSIGGNPRLAIKDPRLILDKGYVRDGILYLSTFLRERGFEGACTGKELKQPSTLTVFNIFKFLIRRGLPRHEMAKLDEVLSLLIVLGYPCKINKSWLTAVGSPHAWPHLLAAMRWLCHSIESDELSDSCEAAVFASSSDDITMFPGEDEGKPPAQRRQEFHAESYEAFMEHGEVELEGSDYKRQCDLKENQLLQNIRDVDITMDKCQRDIQEASADPSPLQRVQEEVRRLAADKHKFEVLIQQLEGKTHQESIAIQQKTEQLQDEERLFGVLEAERLELEKRVASQPLSLDDVQLLTAENEQLCAERRDLRHKLSNLEKETWQAEMDSNKLEKALVEEKQQILASGFDFANNKFASIQDQLLVDEDALRRQRLTLQGEMDKLRQMVIKQQEFVSTLESDMQLDQATNKRKLQQLEDEYQRELARSEQFRIALHSRLESKGEGQRLADAQDALRQAQSRLEQTKLRCRTELKEKEEFLKAAMSKIAEHIGLYENRVIARLQG